MAKGYITQVAIAVDQLCNAVFGGWSDETFSSRCYRKDRDGIWWGRFCRPAVDFIFFWQEAHCYKAYKSEQLRNHLPAEFRGD